MINDYTVNSTDNNEYADGDRDENLWFEDLFDTDIPEDDLFSDESRPRPEYAENGFHKDMY